MRSCSRLKERHEIGKSCHTFFMEVVSTLSFGGKTSPEPDLIGMLLSTVFAEREGTKELSYAEGHTDPIPVIRSFLLQLLLEHK